LKLPEHIRQKVILWVFIVESQGIWEVAKNPGFHDEPLKGDRKGQRSVRMNKAYRIIYIVIKDRIHIELIEVTRFVGKFFLSFCKKWHVTFARKN
jgi:toxin HigB-1